MSDLVFPRERRRLIVARALDRTVAESAAEWMYYHPEWDPLEAVELPSPGSD